jgi:hypothetical protein
MLDPAVVGAKETVILQFVVGGSGDFAQLSVSEKSPLAVILLKVTAVVPLFVTVMGSVGAGVRPTCWLPNAKLEAESVRVDA